MSHSLDNVVIEPAKSRYRGKVWLFGDDISTDLMQPGFTPHGLSLEERAKYCMRANRPGWSEQVSLGDILIGGRNFGCGSNRPAALNLKILGLGCMVAESVFSVHFRNCINFAFPAMSCPGASKLFKEGDMADVNFETGLVMNVTTGKTLEGRALPKFLMDIMAAGGSLAMLRKGGYIK